MQGAFYQRFSNEIVSLCRSLPRSGQTDAMLFLLRYSGVNLGEELDFFANYYPPAWSVIYWLSQDRNLHSERLTEGDVTNAVKAQSMAMLLHSLDDHLTDGQIPASLLSLLLRSEAWMIMSRSVCNLTKGIPTGKRTVRDFINDYYSSLRDSKEAESLDSYCDLFRRQMAIGMIAPVLLSMKMSGISDFAGDIEIAYGSFGIAWRLLDDIKDIADDMATGAHSAVYLCLPQEARNQWKSCGSSSRALAKAATKSILTHVLEYGVIDYIKERICAELETAASTVAAHNMTDLEREFRYLAHPLRDIPKNWEGDSGNPGVSLASK